MLKGWKRPETLGFLGSPRRLSPPPAARTLCSSRRLYSRSKNFSSLPLWLRGDFFQCPADENVINSAIWPFSKFARDREWRENLEKSINELRNNVKDLERTSISQEFFREFLGNLGKTISYIRKDADESRRRQQKHLTETSGRTAKSLFDSASTQEKSVTRLRLEVEESRDDQKKVFAKLQNEVIQLRSDQTSAIQELKSYIVDSDQEIGSTVTELVKMARELGEGHETVVGQLRDVSRKMTDMMKGLEEGTIQDIERLVHEQPDLLVEEQQTEFPVPYSPDDHLKYVRYVEKIFGFHFEDPALLWQALQYKKGPHKMNVGFNKGLALEGDVALKLARISKSNDTGELSDIVVFRNISNVLESNAHMRRVAHHIGLDKATSRDKGTSSSYAFTIQLATTMEAIFAVIVRQAGIPALCEVLNHIGYEDQQYLNPQNGAPITSPEAITSPESINSPEAITSPDPITSPESIDEGPEINEETEPANEIPINPTEPSPQQEEVVTRRPFDFLRQWFSRPLPMTRESAKPDIPQPFSGNTESQISKPVETENSSPSPVPPPTLETATIHNDEEVKASVHFQDSEKQAPCEEVKSSKVENSSLAKSWKQQKRESRNRYLASEILRPKPLEHEIPSKPDNPDPAENAMSEKTKSIEHEIPSDPNNPDPSENLTTQNSISIEQEKHEGPETPASLEVSAPLDAVDHTQQLETAEVEVPYSTFDNLATSESLSDTQRPTQHSRLTLTKKAEHLYHEFRRSSTEAAISRAIENEKLFLDSLITPRHKTILIRAMERLKLPRLKEQRLKKLQRLKQERLEQKQSYADTEISQSIENEKSLSDSGNPIPSTTFIAEKPESFESKEHPEHSLNTEISQSIENKKPFPDSRESVASTIFIAEKPQSFERKENSVEIKTFRSIKNEKLLSNSEEPGPFEHKEHSADTETEASPSELRSNGELENIEQNPSSTEAALPTSEIVNAAQSKSTESQDLSQDPAIPLPLSGTEHTRQLKTKRKTSQTSKSRVAHFVLHNWQDRTRRIRKACYLATEQLKNSRMGESPPEYAILPKYKSMNLTTKDKVGKIRAVINEQSPKDSKVPLQMIQTNLTALDRFKQTCIRYISEILLKSPRKDPSWPPISFSEFAIDEALSSLNTRVDHLRKTYPDWDPHGEGMILFNDLQSMLTGLKSVLRNCKESADGNEIIYHLFDEYSEVFEGRIMEFDGHDSKWKLLRITVGMRKSLFYARFWDAKTTADLKA